MDTTLLSIFFVLGVVVAWIASYAIKVNRESKSTKKTSGVKDELFGKKKRDFVVSASPSETVLDDPPLSCVKTTQHGALQHPGSPISPEVMQVTSDQLLKVLTLEIGSEESVAEVLKNPRGWKGRAERIIELEEQVRRLSRNIDDVAPTIVVDKKRTHELENQLKTSQNIISVLEQERLSLKSRIRCLEDQVGATRDDIRVLQNREILNSRITVMLRKFLVPN